MAVSSFGGLFAVPTLAAEQVKVNGFTLERESENEAWTVTDFDGSTTNAVIPDAVTTNGEIIDNPSLGDSGALPTNSVAIINEDVFEKMENVETLQLPKYFGTINKTSERSNSEILKDLTNLKEFKSNNEGDRLYTYDGALYVGTMLLSYPTEKSGNYAIKNGTTAIDDYAFKDAEIETLTINDSNIIINEKSQYDDGTEYFEYTLISASVDNFAGDGCVDGALFSDNGTRLVAYGNDATADLSNITSANPRAFQNEDTLERAFENANMPNEVKSTTPFTFYAGDQNVDGSEPTLWQSKYFNINGVPAYCYNFGSRIPENVGDLVDYDEAIADQETINKVKSVLYVGYPNDAYDLLESTGVDEEAAKNITGALVWEAVDDVLFNIDQIYGIEDSEAANAYLEGMREQMASVSNEEMEGLELKFYHPQEEGVQGLVVINKISKPEVPEKPSITISKQDITTKEELPGAQLTVTMGNTVIDSWVSTDTPHIITGLEDGVYTLTEVTAPDGYEKAESIEFTVTDGKVSVDTIVMYDAPEDTYVYISKQDATTKKELPGATLQLIKDDVVVDEWVSTDTPHVIENPADGTYTLVEITAPNGYKVAESITFEVVDGKTSPNPIVMYDEANVATPSEPDKPTTEEPEKPIDGGYSGWEPDEPEETTPDDTDITIIPTEPTETTPEPTKQEETAPEPDGDRKPIKTGDIMGTLQILFGTMTSCGAAGYVIYRKRRK